MSALTQCYRHQIRTLIDAWMRDICFLHAATKTADAGCVNGRLRPARRSTAVRVISIYQETRNGQQKHIHASTSNGGI